MIDPAYPDFTNTPISSRRPHFCYAPADAQSPPAMSIVTPFYNTGAVFHETVQSILQQSLQQWEWLIVNDGSTDAESLAVLDHYRRFDPRLRVIDHDQNRGLSAARNTGFAAARTDIILQIDSDDMIEPTVMEKWFWLLTSYPEYAFVNGYTVSFGGAQSLHASGFSSPRAFLVANNVTATAAVRRQVHQVVGGYDKATRGGLVDWDFWLHCADAGFWGATIPEYMDWYRRREDHGDRWQDMRTSENIRQVHYQLRQRYPKLWQKNGLPKVELAPHLPYASIPNALPCANHLAKQRSRLLIVTGATDKARKRANDLSLIEQVVQAGWEATVAATDGNATILAEMTRHTPDVFILPHILRLVDYPRFLRYLIHSRQVDAVVISASEAGYVLLPYLRAYSPGVPFFALCNLEEAGNVYLHRLAVAYQHLFDRLIVPSAEVRQQMIEQGAQAESISVCTQEGEHGAYADIVPLLTTVGGVDGALTPGLADLWAVQAVECLRQVRAQPTSLRAAPTEGESDRRASALPALLQSVLNRFVMWAVLPDQRLAAPVRMMKRLIPTSVKVALKRRVR